MIPNELTAKPGDKILPKFKKLVAYIDSQKLVSTHPLVQINETGNGTNITLLPRKTSILYDHPFKITLEGDDAFRVSEGYVNNELPFIRTKGRNNKILHKIDDKDGVGVIPKNLLARDLRWLFVCTILANNKNVPQVAYIECMNTELANKQGIILGQMVLGQSHISRKVDIYEGHHEFYVPMAFMREDKIIHNFTWHNIYARFYKIEETNRILFYPG